MKNVLMILAVSAFSLTILSFSKVDNKTTGTTISDNVKYEIPKDVQDIVDKSCYGCHNPESSSTKAKMKLDFDKLPELKTSKQVGKLMKIAKVVENGKMPTDKFLDNYPDRALTQEESNRLVSWAKDLSTEMGGE